MILKIVSILRESIEILGNTQLEVILLEIVFDNCLLRIPFLTIDLLFNSIGFLALIARLVAQLEVR